MGNSLISHFKKIKVANSSGDFLFACFIMILQKRGGVIKLERQNKKSYSPIELFHDKNGKFDEAQKNNKENYNENN